MEITETLARLAETKGWSTEVVDEKNFKIKFVDRFGEAETYLIEIIDFFEPYLHMDVSRFGIFVRSKENNLGPEILKAALKRNSKHKVMRWVLYESSENSALFLRYMLILTMEVQPMLTGFESVFNIMAEESKRFHADFVKQQAEEVQQMITDRLNKFKE